MSTDPTPSTIKMLFALTGNTCALEHCEMPLFKREWKGVRARIAHICGEKKGSARWIEAMNDEERRHFSNLIVICPNCHDLIDTLAPDDYPPQRVRDIKARHESRSESFETWATESDLTHYVEVALVRYFGSEPLRDEGLTTAIASTAEVTVQAPSAFGQGSGVPAEIHVGENTEQPGTIHEESRTDDSVGPSNQEMADSMILEFLRQRLTEGSGPIRPEVIADGLPLGMDVVAGALTRLYEAGKIEGDTVEEQDYPVMVTRVV